MLQHKPLRLILFAVITAVMYLPVAQGSQQSWLHSFGTLINGLGVSSSKTGSNPTSTRLTPKEMSQGIKEALSKGVTVAIDQLGRRNGYLDDAAVKIPLPTRLKQVGNLLRKFHQGSLADEFIASMNHAAEQAVPQAAGIFAEAIKRMTLQDAQHILQGPNDAATQYFRRTAGVELAKRLRPIIAQTTNKVGVTLAYKRMMAQAGPLAQMLVGNTNLDDYITQKALNGLFLKIAAEEKTIRTRPAARTTELLMKVFASVK